MTSITQQKHSAPSGGGIDAACAITDGKALHAVINDLLSQPNLLGRSEALGALMRLNASLDEAIQTGSAASAHVMIESCAKQAKSVLATNPPSMRAAFDALPARVREASQRDNVIPLPGSTVQMHDGPTPFGVSETTATPFPLAELKGRFGSAVNAFASEKQADPAALAFAMLAGLSFAAQGRFFYTERPSRNVDYSPSLLVLIALAASERKSSTTSRLFSAGLDMRNRRMKELLDPSRNLVRARGTTVANMRKVIEKKIAEAAEAEVANPGHVVPGLPTLASLEEQLAQLPSVKEPPRIGSHLSSGTVRGFMDAFQTEEPSQFLMTAEGSTLLGGHAFTDDQMIETVGFLCALFSNDPYTYRKGGQKWELSLVRMATLILAQPTVMEPLLANPLVKEIGLMARTMIVRPEPLLDRPLSHKVPEGLLTAKIVEAENWLQSVLACPPTFTENFELKLHPVTMSTDCIKMVGEREGQLIAERAKGGRLENLSAFIGRYPEHVKRIATVLQVTEGEALAEPPRDGRAITISEQNTEAAMLLMDWQISEHVRLVDNSVMSEVEQNAYTLISTVATHERYRHADTAVLSLTDIGALFGKGQPLNNANIRREATEWLVNNGWAVTGQVKVKRRQFVVRFLFLDLLRAS